MTAAAMDLMTGLLRVPSADPMTLTIDLGVSSPPPWSLVTGRVTARAGQSLAITRIELSGPALVAALAADVRPDGSFTFPRVPFGVYVARVSPSAGYFPKSVTIGPDDPSRIEIAPPSPKDIVGDFVKIQPGEFMMGCSPGDTECMPEESPAHKVRITKPFELGRFEVTQLQWETVMGSNPSQFKGEDRPVEELNEWKMVETFLEKLNALNDGYRYRVPTEAEWEYAARAGSTGPFSAAPETYIWNLQILARSGALNGVAINTILPGNGLTRPVGQMQPNPWGLFDMQGNVWEWTSDWYSGTYYADSPVEDPRGPASGPMRVMKGGSANTAPFTIRASARGNQPPINRTYIFGLRLAREPIASQQNAPARPQARGPAPPTQAAEVQGVAANGATSVSAVEPCTERRGSGPFGWTDPSWEGLVDRVVTIVDASVQSIAPGGRPVPVQSTEPVKPPLAAGDDFILSVSSVLKGPPSLQRIVVLQPRYGEIWDLRPGQRYILFLIEEDRSLDFSKYADARRYQPVFSASLCVESRKLRVVPSGGGVRQHFEGLSIEQGLTDILTRLAGQ
jgi:formylglycine-generating enzyme required for sulfatase activity